ncbi:RbsD/FucU domain-containing protein [Branchiibius cervicis]|uniref:D-ribose pyranase n=1 Tax=Branchiibius cervicis TaxID=908252 RepID=A0ABW2AUZ2_9MICO
MITTGIIHADLARHLAGLRHTEHLVICDSGLPLGDVPTVDLGYRYGQPGFIDVIETILPAVTLEASWISQPMVQANPKCLSALRNQGLSPQELDHEDFKVRALAAKFAVRTGEDTFYANVICRAGVPFAK